MEHSPIDRYARREGFLQKIHAGWKLIFTIALLFYLSFPIKSVFAPLIILGLCVLLLFLSRIPLVFTLKRLIFTLPFILLVLIMNPHQRIPFFLKVFDSIFLAFLFVTTTPFPELFRLLERLKVPVPFLLIISIGYRFFFLMKDEIEKVIRTWKIRGGEMRYFRMRDTTYIVSSILEKLIRRAGRLAIVLKVRGYNVEA